MAKMENVTAVIRSLGERTTEASRFLISQCIPDKNIRMVKENNVLDTARKGFEEAINGKCEWTLILDGNVLLQPKALESFMVDVQKVDPSVYCVRANLIDKLAGFNLNSGVQMYRTSIIAKYLDDLEKAMTTGNEGQFHQTMNKNGHKFLQFSSTPIGLNDQEQYYRDIYRKSFLYALRHLDWAPNMIPHWRSRAASDADFRVAIRGFGDGVASIGEIGKELNKLRGDLNQVIESMGLKEKGSFAILDANYVHEKMKSFTSHSPLHVYYDEKFVEVVTKEQPARV